MTAARQAVLVYAFGAASVVAPALASGQSAGIEYVGTWAGYEDVLDTPTGFLVYGELPLLHWMGLRFSYIGRSESNVLTGPTCGGLVLPGQDCPLDTMDGDSRLRTRPRPRPSCAQPGAP